MNSGSPVVSFLVVNWNGGDMLRACLDSIAAQTFRDFEVIVVDNGSNDGSADLPHFDRPGWTRIRLDTNTGFSPANNRAFEASQGAWLALVNNDVVLDPEWLEHMVQAARHSPSVGSVACRLLKISDPATLDCAGFEYFSCATTGGWVGQSAAAFERADHAPFGAVASALLYRRSAIERTGLFHPEYFAYYEDTDLGIRLVLFGYDCAYAPRATALHHGSATGGRGSTFSTYHLRRNVELLYWVNMPGLLVLRYLLPHLFYELLCLLVAIGRGMFGVVLRSKRDAFRMRGWIRRERKKQAATLASAGVGPDAGKRLRSRMTPWWKVLVRYENRFKFSPPNNGCGGRTP